MERKIDSLDQFSKLYELKQMSPLKNGNMSGSLLLASE